MLLLQADGFRAREQTKTKFLTLKASQPDSAFGKLFGNMSVLAKLYQKHQILVEGLTNGKASKFAVKSDFSHVSTLLYIILCMFVHYCTYHVSIIYLDGKNANSKPL